MGATSERAYHEFLSHTKPSRDTAENLGKILMEAKNCEWIDVFCVTRGLVDWGSSINFLNYPEKATKIYGPIGELPLIGKETGFLIRHVSQFKDPNKDMIMADQQSSWLDYMKLLIHLTSSIPSHIFRY